MAPRSPQGKTQTQEGALLPAPLSSSRPITPTCAPAALAAVLRCPGHPHAPSCTPDPVPWGRSHLLTQAPCQGSKPRVFPDQRGELLEHRWRGAVSVVPVHFLYAGLVGTY